jgi:hypothetical protein
MFEVNRSSYYAHRLRRRTPDVERLRLRSRVSELFSQSRSAAGSRSLLSLMRDDGEQLGRFKVRSLCVSLTSSVNSQALMPINERRLNGWISRTF